MHHCSRSREPITRSSLHRNVISPSLTSCSYKLKPLGFWGRSPATAARMSWSICRRLITPARRHLVSSRCCSRRRGAAEARWRSAMFRRLSRTFSGSRGSTLRDPESRERIGDRVSDGPGSFRGGAIAGSESGEPNQDHRHHTAEEFAREVASHLDGATIRTHISELSAIA
jgi:hypothetical protein